MVRFLRFLLAILLLPAAWGVSRAFVDIFLLIPVPDGSLASAEAVAVLCGVLAFLALWTILPAPVRL